MLFRSLWTPVTHAIMPVVQQAKIPLVIDISVGQDFVDASGVGGNDYAFKTIPSDLDIAGALIGWLKSQGVGSIAIVGDDNPFNLAKMASMEKSATAAGLKTLANETIPKDTKDLAPLLVRFKTLGPDRIVTVLSSSTVPFFKAYEQSNWRVPITDRIDFASALGALSPSFIVAGGIARATGVTVYNPFIQAPGVKDFIAAYRAKYGIAPTQRSFYAYESTLLIVDAIRRAGSDKSEDIEKALKSSTMPSLLGGNYSMDEHNHPHIPMQIVGVRDGKVTVIAEMVR